MPLTQDHFKSKQEYLAALKKNTPNNGKFYYYKIKFEDGKSGNVLVHGPNTGAILNQFKDKSFAAQRLDEGIVADMMFKTKTGALTLESLTAFGIKNGSVLAPGETQAETTVRIRAKGEEQREAEAEEAANSNVDPWIADTGETKDQFRNSLKPFASRLQAITHPKLKKVLVSDYKRILTDAPGTRLGDRRRDFIARLEKAEQEFPVLEKRLGELKAIIAQAEKDMHPMFEKAKAKSDAAENYYQEGHVSGLEEMIVDIEKLLGANAEREHMGDAHRKEWNDWVTQLGISKVYQTAKTQLKQALSSPKLTEDQKVSGVAFLKKIGNADLRSKLTALESSDGNPKDRDKVGQVLLDVQKYRDAAKETGADQIIHLGPYIQTLDDLQIALKQMHQRMGAGQNG